MSRRGDRYEESVAKAMNGKKLTKPESELLDELEGYTADIIERYPPPGPRKGSGLMFARIYAAAHGNTTEGEDTERRRLLLTALLAAEVETRGPLRLAQAQNATLAATLDKLGAALQDEGLPLHAALAFGRAASLYLLLNEHVARDRALFRRARTRHRAMNGGVRKALMAISWITCGYGYQPYRLLLWVIAQLVVFGVALALTVPNWTQLNLYMGLVSYLNPLSPNDTGELPTITKILLVIESYAGALSLNVFFALLVRRWFR